ncbi:MAG: hypothetical protein EU529_11585 [Promethearchaeota archaeon]|nr:MAG: hypothetical protein EU529_11585 [Candidatus Lokiarchaeota archaeon]
MFFKFIFFCFHGYFFFFNFLFRSFCFTHILRLGNKEKPTIKPNKFISIPNKLLSMFSYNNNYTIFRGI